MLELKQEQLDKIAELTREQKELADDLTEKHNLALFKKEELIKYNNDKGGEIEVKQKIAWQEVKFLGWGCEAGKALSELYPEVKEAYEKQGAKACELKDFVFNTLGFDYTGMTLSDYIELTRAIIRLELKK